MKLLLATNTIEIQTVTVDFELLLLYNLSE